MVYSLIALTIVIYFFIVIRIFHGLNDSKTVSLIAKLQNRIKSKKYKYETVIRK